MTQTLMLLHSYQWYGSYTADFNNIKLDDDNFDKDDPENIFLARIIAWWNRYEQPKACEKQDKWKINAYSIASNKSAGLVYDKRWTVME